MKQAEAIQSLAKALVEKKNRKGYRPKQGKWVKKPGKLGMRPIKGKATLR